MDLPIIKLTVNEDDETRVEKVSFVDDPAISRQWMKFQKEAFESYTDYPQAATSNAKKALAWKEKHGSKCGTATGWARARQLANKRPLSRETVARMASFKRHQKNKDVQYAKGCGGIMWDAWGGTAGIEWAAKKMQKLRAAKFNIESNDQQIVSGPLMVAGLPIYRFDPKLGEYYVQFDAETIKNIVLKFHRERRSDAVNLMHEVDVDGVYMFESFLIDERKPTPIGFDKLPNGSWFGSFKVDNPEVWAKIKSGQYSGFSVEGIFEEYAERMADEELIDRIIHVLQQKS
tara:strand:+ start:529 stop:1395 length:867 start_codon:yes stop_codon:yes gene_type:complete